MVAPTLLLSPATQRPPFFASEKVLSVVAGVPALSESAPVPEDVRGLSGAQYKDKVVSRLFRSRWPGAVSIGMCQVLRDLDLGERQLSVAVSRVLRHLRKSAKLHDLPALTYQLLLLAGRYGLHDQSFVLKGAPAGAPVIAAPRPYPSSPHPVFGSCWRLSSIYAVTFTRCTVCCGTAIAPSPQSPGNGATAHTCFSAVGVRRPTAPVRSNPIQSTRTCLCLKNCART